jgi:D-glycero-alpha-D-manno-heptose 1-phosphate guanylyltransferase
MEAIVLAGGLGTRLRGAIGETPKPLAPVRGRPFIEYLLDYWIGQGVTRFVLSVGYKHEAIAGHFARSYCGAALDFAVEDRPLGTGGGLLLAAGQMAADGAFLVLNGDTYFEVSLDALREFHGARRAQLTLALFRSPRQGRYTGLAVGVSGEVLALNAGEAGGLANGGVYLIERGWLRGGPWRAGSPVSLEEDILPFALRSGKRVYGLECGGRFLDIGVPEDYAKAADLLPSHEPRTTNHGNRQ